MTKSCQNSKTYRDGINQWMLLWKNKRWEYHNNPELQSTTLMRDTFRQHGAYCCILSFWNIQNKQNTSGLLSLTLYLLACTLMFSVERGCTTRTRPALVVWVDSRKVSNLQLLEQLIHSTLSIKFPVTKSSQLLRMILMVISTSKVKPTQLQWTTTTNKCKR